MQNSKPFFSIIMPVYGVEHHLKQAVESILNQTEQDFELILIDDASPDNCPAICDAYADKYKNVSVIHHPHNKGLSEARNTGISHACGEYITFMDSDDYVDADLLEQVNKSLKLNPADCVVFGLIEEYCAKDGTVSKSYSLSFGEQLLLCEQEQVRKTAIKLEEKTFLGYAWNKFYKTSHITQNNLTFETVTLIEDIIFNIRFFEKIKSLNILNTTPYHYMKRIDSSLTNKFVSDYYILHRRRVEELLNLHKNWDMQSPYVLNTLGNIYARYIYSALQRNCDNRSGMTKKERKAFLINLFNDDLFTLLSPHINMNGYAGILYNSLKNKRTSTCLLFGRVIYLVKQKLPIIFAAAKQKR